MAQLYREECHSKEVYESHRLKYTMIDFICYHICSLTTNSSLLRGHSQLGQGWCYHGNKSKRREPKKDKKKISEHKENKDNKTCAFYCRLVLDFGYYDASSQLKIAIFYSMCAFALLKNILKCPMVCQVLKPTILTADTMPVCEQPCLWLCILAPLFSGNNNKIHQQ